MKIIISPAKKMRVDTDGAPWKELPVFLDRADVLKDFIRRLDFAEQKKLWACNEKIAAENHARFLQMDLRENLTPAILSYDGIQYQYMARGDMVRYLAGIHATEPEQMKGFRWGGYHFQENLSTDETYVFLREGKMFLPQ